MHCILTCCTGDNNYQVQLYIHDVLKRVLYIYTRDYGDRTWLLYEATILDKPK